jgi:hypothetical protein
MLGDAALSSLSSSCCVIAGPSGGISLALPYAARGVFNNNDSVKTEGLSGLASVEYRILVPTRRIGLFLGQKGGGGGRERRPGVRCLDYKHGAHHDMFCLPAAHQQSMVSCFVQLLAAMVNG